jgi:hypothetical protein
MLILLKMEPNRHPNVHTVMPDVQPEVEETVGSTDPAPSASSAAADSADLAEKPISALSPELAVQAVDPKRKAMSQDPGWKLGGGQILQRRTSCSAFSV